MTDPGSSPVVVFFAAWAVAALLCGGVAVAALWVDGGAQLKKTFFFESGEDAVTTPTVDADVETAKLEERSEPLDVEGTGNIDGPVSLFDMIEQSLGGGPAPGSTNQRLPSRDGYAVGHLVLVHSTKLAKEYPHLISSVDIFSHISGDTLGPGTIVTVEKQPPGSNCLDDVFWVVMGDNCVRCAAAQLSSSPEAGAELRSRRDVEKLMKDIRFYHDIVDDAASTSAGSSAAPAAESPLRRGAATRDRKGCFDDGGAPAPHEVSFQSVGLLKKLGLLEDPSPASNIRRQTSNDNNTPRDTGWASLDRLEQSLSH